MVSVDILDCEAGAKRGGGGVGEGEKRKTLSPQSPSLFFPIFPTHFDVCYAGYAHVIISDIYIRGRPRQLHRRDLTLILLACSKKKTLRKASLYFFHQKGHHGYLFIFLEPIDDKSTNI